MWSNVELLSGFWRKSLLVLGVRGAGLQSFCGYLHLDDLGLGSNLFGHGLLTCKMKGWHDQGLSSGKDLLDWTRWPLRFYESGLLDFLTVSLWPNQYHSPDLSLLLCKMEKIGGRLDDSAFKVPPIQLKIHVPWSLNEWGRILSCWLSMWVPSFFSR